LEDCLPAQVNFHDFFDLCFLLVLGWDGSEDLVYLLWESCNWMLLLFLDFFDLFDCFLYQNVLLVCQEIVFGCEELSKRFLLFLLPQSRLLILLLFNGFSKHVL
jgi:hypothetical protein